MPAAARGLHALLAAVFGLVAVGCATVDADPAPAATAALAFVAVCQDPLRMTVLTDDYCLGGHSDAAWRFYSESLFRSVGPSTFDAGQKVYGGLRTLPEPDASTDIEVRWGRHATTADVHSMDRPSEVPGSPAPGRG
ncbi:hypothetical protein [Kineosporia succinea]|uniref:Lipoprotein n=1 Tax=Kineosporia succinea TaxID=84632 RepID=A0ABT9P272_9ACTN|nr:hypothetical protein [Kineosporia succinea]MDP9826778.1 hypothetical protein [Kineosporia succinea]